MTQHRGRRTNGGSTAARAQTLHDYIAGISVFVLTLAVVLGLLPSVLAPYEAGGNSGDISQAERIGDHLVSNLSSATGPNVVNATELSSVLNESASDLQNRSGLREFQYVNVSVTTLNGSRVLSDGTTNLTGGASAFGEDTSSATRIVQLTDPAYDCRPACRLVVRVW